MIAYHIYLNDSYAATRGTTAGVDAWLAANPGAFRVVVCKNGSKNYDVTDFLFAR